MPIDRRQVNKAHVFFYSLLFAQRRRMVLPGCAPAHFRRHFAFCNVLWRHRSSFTTHQIVPAIVTECMCIMNMSKNISIFPTRLDQTSKHKSSSHRLTWSIYAPACLTTAPQPTTALLIITNQYVCMASMNSLTPQQTKCTDMMCL